MTSAKPELQRVEDILVRHVFRSSTHLHLPERVEVISWRCGHDGSCEARGFAETLEAASRAHARHLTLLLSYTHHILPLAESPMILDRQTPNGVPYKVARWQKPYGRIQTVVGDTESPTIDLEPLYTLYPADLEELAAILLSQAAQARLGEGGNWLIFDASSEEGVLLHRAYELDEAESWIVSRTGGLARIESRQSLRTMRGFTYEVSHDRMCRYSYLLVHGESLDEDSELDLTAPPVFPE